MIGANLVVPRRPAGECPLSARVFSLIGCSSARTHVHILLCISHFVSLLSSAATFVLAASPGQARAGRFCCERDQIHRHATLNYGPDDGHSLPRSESSCGKVV